MKKVKLDFMVVPEELARIGYVPKAVQCKILAPQSTLFDSILGASGRKLAAAGATFLFTKSLADVLLREKLIRLV